MSTPYIRPSAICLIRRRNQILVFIGTDTVKGNRYARPLGGGIDFFEHSSETVKREMMEETGQVIDSPQFLEVIENRFWLEGRRKLEQKPSSSSLRQSPRCRCLVFASMHQRTLQ